MEINYESQIDIRTQNQIKKYYPFCLPRRPNVGAKHDRGKEAYHIIDPKFNKEIAEILTFGMEKYGEDSFKTIDNPQKRYYSALRRHIEAWRMGETNDPETGKSHLAHVAVNAMFLYHFTTLKENENV